MGIARSVTVIPTVADAGIPFGKSGTAGYSWNNNKFYYLYSAGILGISNITLTPFTTLGNCEIRTPDFDTTSATNGLYIFSGSNNNTSAFSYGAELQGFAGQGYARGGSFTFAAGNCSDPNSNSGGNGPGGSFSMYSGGGATAGGPPGSGPSGLITLSTYNGTSLDIDDLNINFYLNGVGYPWRMLNNAGVTNMGFFGAVPVPRQTNAFGIHYSLSQLGLTSGLPDDSVFIFTNTATVGNVTINNVSGRVIMANAATTLTLTSSKITANSRILLTWAGNPGSNGVLYATAAAGSCTIGTTVAPTANTSIHFQVVN